jgi:hypothetical protein
MRRVVCLISGFCMLAACGQASAIQHQGPGGGQPPPSDAHPAPPVLVGSFLDCLSPGHDYDLPNQGPPVPELLAADRSCGAGRLQAVGAEITPKVSGAAAYELCCDGGGEANGMMTEELAYYSAPTPATIPAECVPAPTKQLPPECSSDPAAQWYHHTLVWFFVWKADCAPTLGPPGPRSNVPPACVWFTSVDATTGQQGMLTGG